MLAYKWLVFLYFLIYVSVLEVKKRPKNGQKWSKMVKIGVFGPFWKKFKKKFYFCPNSAPKKGRAQPLKSRVDF